MDKKIILLITAATCIGLYFYDSQVKKDSQLVKLLPIVGGLAFGFNTLIQITQQ